MFEHINNIFIVGIKGVAMTNLALILKKMGKCVSGSDLAEEFITDYLLRDNAISQSIGFEPFNLPRDTDLVIYSAAHLGVNNPQVIEAKRRGLKVMSQAEAIEHLMKNFKNKIAVCGSHGKTTTASLLIYCLIKLNSSPSYIVGAPNFGDYPGGDYRQSDYFVVEADEYAVNPPLDKRPKFHLLQPNFIIATNIDFDHPDVYEDLNQTKQAFAEFFKKVVRINKPCLFACSDDQNLMDVLRTIPRDHYQTFGLGNEVDLKINNPVNDENHSSFNLVYRGKDLGRFELSIFGHQNISNAAGVILCLINLGFNIEEIRKVTSGFGGAKRRFEMVAKIGNSYLFDDYAHHPKEIETTIRAARARFKNKRLIIIFQPHTFSRTKSLLNDFAKSLSLADLSLIMPIFASARENAADFKISAFDIEKEALNSRVKAIATTDSLIDKLSGYLRSGDIIFTMGAGDVYKLKDDIIKILKIAEKQ